MSGEVSLRYQLSSSIVWRRVCIFNISLSLTCSSSLSLLCPPSQVSPFTPLVLPIHSLVISMDADIAVCR